MSPTVKWKLYKRKSLPYKWEFSKSVNPTVSGNFKSKGYVFDVAFFLPKITLDKIKYIRYNIDTREYLATVSSPCENGND